jgi:hypothetical protein
MSIFSRFFSSGRPRFAAAREIIRRTRRGAEWRHLLVKNVIRTGIALAACATAVFAQSFLNPLTTAGMDQNGPHLYSVSAFTGYLTSHLSGPGIVTDPNRPAYYLTSGASASLGYSRRTSERTDFAVMYAPSYAYGTSGIGANRMTHAVAMSWGYKLSPNWRFSTSASGVTGNFSQLLFSPTAEQTLVSLAGSFDELAGAVLTGQSTNQNLATAATSASAIVAPEQRLFYGSRILSGHANAGLTYSRSERLTIGFSASGNRMQHLRSQDDTTDAYVLPQSTAVTASLSIGYMLSPRTSISASVSSGRTLSHLYDTGYNSVQVGAGRKLTERLFAQASIGMGRMIPIHQSSPTSYGPQYSLSGSVGYRGGGHSLIASVSRMVYDYYGLGADATMSMAAGWAWRRRGSGWGLHAAIAQSRLLGNNETLLGRNGYRANVGFTRAVTHHTFMVLQYAYASYSGYFSYLLAQAPASLQFSSQHSIRLNFTYGAGGGMGEGRGPNSAGGGSAIP